LFNIHSGGGERTIDQQIQTFKALCENTSFDVIPTPANTTGSAAGTQPIQGTALQSGTTGGPAVHIDLHIHLPENKSRRDYEDIIENIGRYIFGREMRDRSEV
jgi:hypothetical protein